MAKTTVILR